MKVMANAWQTRGMGRVRISTTVDEATLIAARGLGFGNDAAVIDVALAALVAAHRRAEIDASYAIYEQIPLSAPDEWGDLESFMDAVDRANHAAGPR